MTSGDNILLVVSGLPCSGKSTYIAKRFPPPISQEVEIFDEKVLRNLGRILRYLNAAAWENKTLVVVEGVFFDSGDRRKIIEWAYSKGYTPHCVMVDTELDICLERNAKREEKDRVAVRHIKKLFREVKVPSVFEGFASVKREYGNGESL